MANPSDFNRKDSGIRFEEVRIDVSTNKIVYVKKNSMEQEPKDLFTVPEEEGLANPYQWSHTKTVAPLSFMNPDVLKTLDYHINAPAPTYLKYSELVPKPDDTKKEKILFGWKMMENGIIRCVE